MVNKHIKLTVGIDQIKFDPEDPDETTLNMDPENIIFYVFIDKNM